MVSPFRSMNSSLVAWMGDRSDPERYDAVVDPLERDDRARSLATPPEEKLVAALEMMAAGMRMARYTGEDRA